MWILYGVLLFALYEQNILNFHSLDLPPLQPIKTFFQLLHRCMLKIFCNLVIFRRNSLCAGKRAVEDAGFCNVCHTSMLSNGKAVGGSVQGPWRLTLTVLVWILFLCFSLVGRLSFFIFARAIYDLTCTYILFVISVSIFLVYS